MVDKGWCYYAFDLIVIIMPLSVPWLTYMWLCYLNLIKSRALQEIKK